MSKVGTPAARSDADRRGRRAALRAASRSVDDCSRPRRALARARRGHTSSRPICAFSPALSTCQHRIAGRASGARAAGDAERSSAPASIGMPPLDRGRFTADAAFDATLERLLRWRTTSRCRRRRAPRSARVTRRRCRRRATRCCATCSPTRSRSRRSPSMSLSRRRCRFISPGWRRGSTPKRSSRSATASARAAAARRSSSMVVGWPARTARASAPARCAARMWNYVRIKCTLCGSTKGIAYQRGRGRRRHDQGRDLRRLPRLREDPPPAQGSALDPVADDVASLGLDLLVRETRLPPRRRQSVPARLLRTPMARTATADLRKLPSVDEVLRTAPAAAAIERFGRPAVVDAVRRALADARARRGRRADGGPDADDRRRRRWHGSKRRRSPACGRCSTSPARCCTPISAARCLPRRRSRPRSRRCASRRRARIRSRRPASAASATIIVRGLLCELTGAEDATVVNNNAAAVLLVLNTLAAARGDRLARRADRDRRRLPHARHHGARRRAAGRGRHHQPHPREGLAAAIGPKTGLVLKVHTSNYRIEGFTKAVSATATWRHCAASASVPLVHDLGSGTLVDLARFGLAHEPTVAEAVADGADLVTFSGDKLLGGPQAGFIVGRKDLIAAAQPAIR